MDPTLRTNTTTALKNSIAQFSPQMKVAAKYILDNPTAFGLDSIRETARKAHVSTYTFVKIAKYLDFDSFEDLRKPYRHALVASSSSAVEKDWLVELRRQSEAGQIYADAAENTLSIVGNSLERQQLQELENIVEMLISARSVYLTAVRSSYSVAYYLYYVGRMALPTLQLIPRHQNSAIDDLNDASTGDVLIAITVTPYSRETIEACEFAKKRGVKLVLLTDSPVVSPDLEPDYTLVASVLSTHHFGCFSGMMAMVELLIALLMKKGGDSALKRIKSYEKLRIENNAYWVPQKKH